MMKLETDTNFREPQAGDIFVTVHKNNYMSSYLIGHTRDDIYTLTSLSTGQTNYTGSTIQAAIDCFFTIKAGPDINPIKHYFFLKSGETTFVNKNPFGHTKVDIKEMTREDFKNMATPRRMGR